MKGGYALAWRKESTPLAKFGTQLPLDVRAESGFQRWMLLEGIVICPACRLGKQAEQAQGSEYRRGEEEAVICWAGKRHAGGQVVGDEHGR